MHNDEEQVDVSSLPTWEEYVAWARIHRKARENLPKLAKADEPQ